MPAIVRQGQQVRSVAAAKLEYSVRVERLAGPTMKHRSQRKTLGCRPFDRNGSVRQLVIRVEGHHDRSPMPGHAPPRSLRWLLYHRHSAEMVRAIRVSRARASLGLGQLTKQSQLSPPRSTDLEQRTPGLENGELDGRRCALALVADPEGLAKRFRRDGLSQQVSRAFGEIP